MKSLVVFAFVLKAAWPSAAEAQTPSTSTPVPAARCEQLIAWYDRFGASRSTNSDGRREITRINAEICCTRGRHAEGIAIMEDLLRRKKFTPPPPGPNVPEDRD